MRKVPAADGAVDLVEARKGQAKGASGGHREGAASSTCTGREGRRQQPAGAGAGSGASSEQVALGSLRERDPEEAFDVELDDAAAGRFAELTAEAAPFEGGGVPSEQEALGTQLERDLEEIIDAELAELASDDAAADRVGAAPGARGEKHPSVPPDLSHLWLDVSGACVCRHCLLHCSAKQRPLADQTPCSGCCFVADVGVDRPRLLSGPLRLSLDQWVHETHAKLWHRRGVAWCGACGAYGAGKRAYKLRWPCAPPTDAGKEVLARTAKGLTPRKETSWQW